MSVLRALVLVGAVLSLLLNTYWLLLYLFHRSLISEEPEKFSNKKVVVIVPAFNEESCVGECVNSLLRLDYPSDLFEVLVVDDGSTDNTWGVLQRFRSVKNVKLVRRVKNSGKKSVALNYASKFVSDDVDLVAVLDADSIVDRNALKRILPFFESERTGAVSIRYMPSNTGSFLGRMQMFEYMYSILWRKLLSLINSMYVTPGVFSVYKKKVLDEVGWFNESSLTEDMELALRIQKSGYRIEYSFKARALTKVPETFKSWWRQRNRWHRGFVNSLLMHRDVLFNKELGSFGLVMMPLQLFSILLVVFLSFLMGVGVVKYFVKVVKFFYKLFLIDFDYLRLLTPFSFRFPDLVDHFYREFLKTDLLLMVTFASLALALVVLYVVMRRTEERLGVSVMFFPLFLGLYLPLNSLSWLPSIVAELLNARSEW